MPDPVALAILAVSAVGLADSIYFLVARPPLMDTRYGRVLRWPNAAFGVAWYLVGAIGGAFHIARGELPLCALFVLAALATVLFSIYLAWALIVRLRTFCVFCFAGYACNAALLGLFSLACAQG